jgi:glutaredoxin
LIHIFKTDTCAYCPMVIKYLAKLNVPFEVHQAQGDNYGILADQFGVTVPLIYNDKTETGMVGLDYGRLKVLAGV